MKLVDMSPMLAIQNCSHGSLPDTEFLRKSSLRNSASGVARSNKPHLIVGEFGAAVTFASRHYLRTEPGMMSITAASAALGLHIRHVFSVGSSEQVVRTATESHVAAVAHEKPMRNRAIHEFVSNAMGATAFVMDHGLAVSAEIDGTLPQPVRATDIDVQPEGSKAPLNVTMAGPRAEHTTTRQHVALNLWKRAPQRRQVRSVILSPYIPNHLSGVSLPAATNRAGAFLCPVYQLRGEQ